MFLRIIEPIEGFLNTTTMYRLMLYFLIFLWIVVFAISIFGSLSFNPLHFISSTFIILLTCYFANKIFSKIFNAPTNLESAYITALILIFIILPARNAEDLFFHLEKMKDLINNGEKLKIINILKDIIPHHNLK